MYGKSTEKTGKLIQKYKQCIALLYLLSALGVHMFIKHLMIFDNTSLAYYKLAESLKMLYAVNIFS